MLLQGGRPGPSIPEDPGGQTSSLKATKSAPPGPPSWGSSPPAPRPGGHCTRPQSWEFTQHHALPVGSQLTGMGFPHHRVPRCAGGLRKFRVGHHPSQRLGHSRHPRGHPLRSPPPPVATWGLPGVDAPRLCLSGRCHSASRFQDSSVFRSLLSVAEWTPLCARTTCSSPTCLPTLGGLAVWLQRIWLL